MKIHKTIVLSMMLFGGVTLTVAPIQEAKAIIPIADIIKKGVEVIIRAFDLMVQRLQNEIIWLQNAQKVVENVLSDLKLTEIAQWTQKQRDLYRKFHDELWRVRSAIATYQRVQDVIRRQVLLVENYKRSWAMVSQDNQFTKGEKEYMFTVYAGILHESIRTLDQLVLVINSLKLQMSDASRLETINKAAAQIDNQSRDMQKFNAHNIATSLSRAKNSYEIQTLKKLYGLP